MGVFIMSSTACPRHCFKYWPGERDQGIAAPLICSSLRLIDESMLLGRKWSTSCQASWLCLSSWASLGFPHSTQVSERSDCLHGSIPGQQGISVWHFYGLASEIIVSLHPMLLVESHNPPRFKRRVHRLDLLMKSGKVLEEHPRRTDIFGK